VAEIRVAEIPVEDLVGESWQGVLSRLTEDMDPWAIDVTELAHRFRAYLSALQDMRFEIPGRMVVACSVLLRIKSDDLLASQRPTPRDELIDEVDEAIEEEIDTWIDPGDPEGFQIPILRRPHRQVTLFDLTKALAGE